MKPILRSRSGNRLYSSAEMPRGLPGDVHRFSAGAIALLDYMCLTAIPARERFIPKNVQRISAYMRLTKKNPLSLAHVGCILSPETLLAGDSQLLLASTDFFWFGAILPPMTVLTGSFSGIAATNQCFSSRPHKNFCLARSSSCTSNWRLSKARCFSRGCKFRTSISCLLPGAVRISKNSPALSRRMSMTICGGYSVDPVLFQRMRRGGGAASITLTRAPIREKNRSKLLPTAFSFLL
jgi:hypothetical protein